MYAIEQIFLIYFTYIIVNPKTLGAIVSIYIVIMLSSFSLQKLFLRSRMKILEEMIQEISSEKDEIESKAGIIYDKYKELVKEVKEVKLLNNVNTKKLDRGEKNV